MTLPEKNCSDTMSSLFYLLLEKAPYQASPGSRVRAVRPKCWYLSSMICMMVTLLYWTSLCLPGKLWQPMEDGEGVNTPASSGTFVLFPVAQLLEQTLIKRNESTSNYRVRKEACRNIWITVRTSLTWSPSPAPPLVWPHPRWSSALQNWEPSTTMYVDMGTGDSCWGDHWPHSTRLAGWDPE